MNRFGSGFAAFALGCLAVQAAQAQYWEPGYRHPPRYGYRDAPRPLYRPAYWAPRSVVEDRPHCWVRPGRVWDGFMWVRRPVRVCR